MKVFFDTNVYIAEVLLGRAAEKILQGTVRAGWRILLSEHVLQEVEKVLIDRFRAPRRYAKLSVRRIRRRAILATPPSSKHRVPDDPKDSPILIAALAGGADYLVTNDFDLLALNPYEGLKIISMTDYFSLLVNEGFLNQ